MNQEVFNAYIVNYVKNDKTNRAVLLTAPWGEGKTYYVKNNLERYLTKNKIKFTYISLYGIKNVNDLNKYIYLDIKSKKINEKSEIKSATKIIGKTIIRGITSFFNVDLNLNENDLKELYSSVDIERRLLIFDDFERSSIDVTEIMGYVNNLVEHDGAKALFIADESAILSNSKISKNYERIKEKTIGDTILYSCDYLSSITGITSMFLNNSLFKNAIDFKDGFISEFTANERILYVMQLLQNFNLRSVLSACQKTYDIFSLMKKDYYPAFLQNILLGNVAYYLKNDSTNKKWPQGNALSSAELACQAYPVMKPAYLYIKLQIFDEAGFDTMNDMFITAVKQEKANQYLQILYNWFTLDEKTVKDALEVVSEKISDISTIPVSEYLRLANYLISMRGILKYDFIIDKCLNIILENTKKEATNSKKIDIYLHNGLQLFNNNQLEEFNDFKGKINELIKTSETNEFNNEFNDLKSFIEMTNKDRNSFIHKGGFMSKINIDILVDKIKKASPEEIVSLRRCFHGVYSFHNIKDYYTNDSDNLKKLFNELIKLKSFSGYDEIQKLQIGWFSNDIKQYLQLLGVTINVI